MPALAQVRRDVPRFLSQNSVDPPPAFRPRPHATAVALEGHTEAALRHAAVAAGIELDVFTPLGSGSLPAQGVADALGLEVERLAPLLEALTLTGLLLRHGELYANAPEAERYLVRGEPDYLGARFLLDADGLTGAESIAARIRQVWAKDAGEQSLERVRSDAERSARRLALALHLGQHQRLLEVGAGGGIAVPVCQLHTDLHALISTGEAALEQTRSRVEEAALDRRIQVASPHPRGLALAECDVVVVWDVLRPRPAASLLNLLNDLNSTVIPGARLHYLGWIRDDRGSSPAGAVLRALSGDPPAMAPNEGDIRATLLQAGYFDVVRRPAPSGIGPGGLTHVVARRT